MSSVEFEDNQSLSNGSIQRTSDFTSVSKRKSRRTLYIAIITISWLGMLWFIFGSHILPKNATPLPPPPANYHESPTIPK